MKNKVGKAVNLLILAAMGSTAAGCQDAPKPAAKEETEIVEAAGLPDDSG